ncbi:serine/arginine repetitive matrix protein 2 [Streptomyces bungoensis]|uniref:serine/arginine repetitive matrix protein 2 n=1 Tax=Streptomyces bungoensis TaxID=285568 RepID=UPI0036A2FB2D
MAIQTPWGTPYGGPPLPPVPAKDLRPRRVWYLVAALVALVLVGAGVVLIVVTVKDTVDAVDAARTFPAGDSRTFHLVQGETKAIYVSPSAAADGVVDCRVPGLGSGSLARPSGTFHITVGSRTWDRVFEVRAARSGDYTLTCTAQRPAEFALGDRPHVATMVGGILTAIGCFLAAFAGGTAITVVTAVRRGRHRRRLTAARAPGPQWGPPPTGPAPGQPGGPWT